MKKKTINIIEGTMKFIGLWDPVILETAAGDVDILPIICKFFEDNNGKTAREVTSGSTFSMKVMEGGRKIDYTREYKDGKLDSFGLSLEGKHWTNMRYYLESTLTALAGRKDRARA